MRAQIEHFSLELHEEHLDPEHAVQDRHEAHALEDRELHAQRHREQKRGLGPEPAENERDRPGAKQRRPKLSNEEPRRHDGGRPKRFSGRKLSSAGSASDGPLRGTAQFAGRTPGRAQRKR